VRLPRLHPAVKEQLSGSPLRPEVLAQLQQHVPDLFAKARAAAEAEAAAAAAAAEKKAQAAADKAAAGAAGGEGGSSSSAGAQGSAPSAGPRVTASGQKVPKWMKL
jgi:septal ring factor EnvC (AmiA/AmiB activator)